MRARLKLLVSALWLPLAGLLISGATCLSDDGRTAPFDGNQTSLESPTGGIAGEGSSIFEPCPDAPDWCSLHRLSPAVLVTDPPGWMVRVGFLALQRPNVICNPLIQSSVDESLLSDSVTWNFGWVSGIDLGLSHRFSGESLFDGWDARYMGIEGSPAQTAFDPQGSWTIPGSSPVWPETIFNSWYGTRLSSAEWNVHRDGANGHVTLLAGFRWLQLNDSLLGNAQFTSVDALNLRINTTNQLFGGQVGAAVGIWKENSPLEVAARFKTGLYNNASETRSFIEETNASGVSTWTGSAGGNGMAFVGDLEFDVIYHLSDRWSLQLGYQMLWLEGLAVAGNQSQFGGLLEGVPAFNSGGGAWFSGVSVGGRFQW